MNTADTIVAIASAPGEALRGIVRVSGDAALNVVERAAGLSAGELNSSSGPCLAQIKWAVDDQLNLDLDLQVWPTSRSYTREPVVEVHTVSSPPLLELIMEGLVRSGARLAEPGEFTMRAFLAGRMDLTQAEAVLGVIDAENERTLDLALQQLAGGLSHPLQTLRENLLASLAHLEAGLDFVEEDIEFISSADLVTGIDTAQDRVDEVIQQMEQRGGGNLEPRVVLLGAPNAGKSSLFNCLLGESAAIVTERAGTTRDFVSGKLKIGDQTCLLVDTAGLEETPHAAAVTVEEQAQHVTEEELSRAEVILWCVSSESGQASPPIPSEIQDNPRTLFIITKCDLSEAIQGDPRWLKTSSVHGQGLEELRQRIADRIQRVQVGEMLPNTMVRCSSALQDASDSLRRARSVAEQQLGEELVALELRQALDALGRVVGAVYTDDILDQIFSQFCIGK